MKIYSREENDQHKVYDLDIKDIDKWATNIKIDGYDINATPEERTKKLQHFYDKEINNPFRNNEDKEMYHRGYVPVPARRDDEKAFDGDLMDTLAGPDYIAKFLDDEATKHIIKRMKEILKKPALYDVAIQLVYGGYTKEEYAEEFNVPVSTVYARFKKAMDIFAKHKDFIKELENMRQFSAI